MLGTFFLSSLLPRRPLSHTARARRMGAGRGEEEAHGGTLSRVLQQCPVVERGRVSFFSLSLSLSLSVTCNFVHSRLSSVDFSRPRRLSKVTLTYTTLPEASGAALSARSRGPLARRKIRHRNLKRRRVGIEIDGERS